MKEKIILKSISFGALGSWLLIVLYFLLVTLISGRDFAFSQFETFWYYLVSLALGFGLQIGLYTYLKNAIRQKGASKKVLAVSGTTSAIAMISCCAHYLVNILPVLAISGFLSLVGQYQIELFWLGLVFNFAGIIYIARKVLKFRKEILDKN
ncbi:MAG: hypothetical protein ACD_12C00515G0003 [uncultured bacterium]|nr:MAG: hypothetical protein ACD_12C00515G0003 [uncultured bacterium]